MNGPIHKRLFDLALALPALVLSLPVQALVATAILWKLGRPVLFRQVRPGLGARPFTLIKFRTMHEIDPTRGLTDDKSRMTKLGSMLRITSLDELPTLWNVVTGDMSLVGPRPLLMHYLERYSPEQNRRHQVRPGVTGLAQVSGRNELPWDEKLALDVAYVDGRTFHLDLKILFLTVVSVIGRRGINTVGHVTTTEFLGSNAKGHFA